MWFIMCICRYTTHSRQNRGVSRNQILTKGEKNNDISLVLWVIEEPFVTHTDFLHFWKVQCLSYLSYLSCLSPCTVWLCHSQFFICIFCACEMYLIVYVITKPNKFNFISKNYCAEVQGGEERKMRYPPLHPRLVARATSGSSFTSKHPPKKLLDYDLYDIHST